MKLVVASSAAAWADVRALFTEYVDSLGFPLDFQDVAREFAALPEEYGPPSGVALVAYAYAGASAAGAVGVREFAPGVGELKRMYVRPAFRGHGLGRELAAAAVAQARELGYASLRLDTLAEMAAATAVYVGLGFREIPAYRHNPLPSARYFELDLTLPPGPSGA